MFENNFIIYQIEKFILFGEMYTFPTIYLASFVAVYYLPCFI